MLFPFFLYIPLILIHFIIRDQHISNSLDFVDTCTFKVIKLLTGIVPYTATSVHIGKFYTYPEVTGVKPRPLPMVDEKTGVKPRPLLMVDEETDCLKR